MRDNGNWDAMVGGIFGGSDIQGTLNTVITELQTAADAIKNINVDGVDDAFINSYFGDYIEGVYSYRTITSLTSVPFGTGTQLMSIQIGSDELWNKALGRSEIVTEDGSVTHDYVYLPYQFYTSGGYEIGDKYEFEYYGKNYDLTVKGFLTTPYFGCNNSGVFEFVVSQETLDEIRSTIGADYNSVCTIVDLKDDVNPGAFMIRFSNKIAEINSGIIVVAKLMKYPSQYIT